MLSVVLFLIGVFLFIAGISSKERRGIRTAGIIVMVLSIILFIFLMFAIPFLIKAEWIKVGLLRPIDL
jgi:hypothetical protein